MNKLINALVLPPQITDFEQRYLKRMNRIGLVFFALHLPIFTLVAWFNDTNPASAIVLTLAVLVGPALAYKTVENPRLISMTYGFTAMLMGGLLVHFGQGPVQIEMHFYFFALLAMLALFGNPLVIVTAAATVAVHHLLVWVIVPDSVFNYEAPIWVVAVHAAFVVLESVATCFIARSFFDNVIGLEKIVHTRTQQLDSKNRDLRLVLDNVQQGFITVNRDGTMSSEVSAVTEQWLGRVTAGLSFERYLAERLPDFALSFKLGLQEIIDDVMPLEVTIEQMPRRFSLDGRSYEVDYAPIFEGQNFEKLLVVVSDVTLRRQREALEAEQREVLRVFDRVMSDKAGFLEFYEEASELVHSIVGDRVSDVVELKRMLHTLKGNSALFGIQTVADLCHAMETQVEELAGRPKAAERQELEARWTRLRQNLDTLWGNRKHRHIEIDDAQYEAILGCVLRGESHDKLARMIAEWKLEPTIKRLERIAKQAEGIAHRLDKGALQIQIRDNDLRLDPGQWGSFWSSFVHVVRNAVDHGLEGPDERDTKGKHPSGALTLETSIESEDFVVSISDDGRGIDWQAVASKAASMGIPHGTHHDLEQALFSDGLTTKASLTQFSGRGIGMGAVLAACVQQGGHVRVKTREGAGTTVEFRFPRSVMMASLPVQAA